MHQIPESYHSPAAFKNSAILKLTESFRGRTLGSILSSLKLRAVKMHQWNCIFQSYAQRKQFIKNANKPKKQHRRNYTQNKKCVSSRASVLAHLSVRWSCHWLVSWPSCHRHSSGWSQAHPEAAVSPHPQGLHKSNVNSPWNWWLKAPMCRIWRFQTLVTPHGTIRKDTLVNSNARNYSSIPPTYVLYHLKAGNCTLAQFNTLILLLQS